MEQQPALVLKNFAVVGYAILMAALFFLMGTSGRILFAPFLTVYLLLVFTEGLLVAGPEVPRREVAMLSFAAALFFCAFLFLSLFIESAGLRALMALAVGIANAVYYTHLFFYLHVPSRYEPNALESVAWYLHLVSLFSISAGLGGLHLFTQVSVILLTVIFIVVAGAIVGHVLWMAKVETKRAKQLSLAGALQLGELFVAALFLPTSLYVNASLLALAGYALFFLFRANMKETHRLKTTYRVGFLAVFLFVLLALTAPWR